MCYTYASYALTSAVLFAAGCTREKLEDYPGQCTLVTGRLVH